MIVVAGLQNTFGGSRIVSIEVAQASTNTQVVEQKKVEEPVKEIPVAKVEKKKNYTYEELEKMVRDVWKEDADNALKIMACESSNNPNKIGDTDLMYWQNGKQYGDSIGLFQYRTFPDRPDREVLKDPVTNIRLAHELYEARGWYQWQWCYEHRVLNNN